MLLFEYKESSNTGNFTAINQFSQVASEHLVIVKACVKKLSSVKHQRTQNGADLLKQDGMLCDPTSYTKVVFWGSQTNAVQQGGTNDFVKSEVDKET